MTQAQRLEPKTVELRGLRRGAAMSTVDRTGQWTLALGQLRARAAKRRRRQEDPSDDDITTALWTASEGLLQELAGAYLECDRHRAERNEWATAWEELFQAMPTACLVTDHEALILRANRKAGLLLNVAANRLKDRRLLLFTEQREAFIETLSRIGRESNLARASFTIRPRERRSTEVEATVMPASNRSEVLWFLVPTDYRVARTPLESPSADAFGRLAAAERH